MLYFKRQKQSSKILWKHIKFLGLLEMACIKSPEGPETRIYFFRTTCFIRERIPQIIMSPCHYTFLQVRTLSRHCLFTQTIKAECFLEYIQLGMYQLIHQSALDEGSPAHHFHLFFQKEYLLFIDIYFYLTFIYFFINTQVSEQS